MNLQLETTPLCLESSSQAAEYLHSFLTLPSLAMDTKTVRSLARSCLKKFLLSPHQSANKKVGEMPWIPPCCSCCPALASSNRYILWLCRYPHVYVLIPNIASFDIEERRGQDEMSISSSFSSSDSKWDIRMWCKQHMHLDMEEHCARPSVIKCKFFSFNIPCKYLQHKKNYYDILVARTYFWRHSVTLIVVYCIVRCCCWKKGRGERKQRLSTRVDDMTGEAGKIIITWITFPLV